jgi:hypothetical protein
MSLNGMMESLLMISKPVKVFGFTKSHDPLHPLMLGYDTQLTEIINEK